MARLEYKKIGVPVGEVGKKIKELNEILKEHNMILKAENDVGICFWKDENTAISLKLEVVLLSDNKEEEEKKRRKRKMDKCRRCGKMFMGIGKLCPDCESDVRIPKKEANPFAEIMSEAPYEALPPTTQQRIHEIMEAMKDLLLYKNQKYGDSAINPKKIFYKGDSTNSILIRLDDKIGRIMSNTEEKPRVNDVADIIGYCTLLLISMGVTAENIAKFKD